MDKVKVFFIAPASNIHTIRWVNALSEEFEIHLISCKNHIESLDKINEKVTLHELPFPSPLGYYMNVSALKKLYKEIKPDIINVHYASGYGTLTRRAKIKPVLISVWGSDVYDFPHESKIKNRIFKKNILNAEYIASTSEAMARELKKNVETGNREIFITPFGVDIEKFKKTEMQKETSEFRIGNIKTLEPKYGIEYSILAVKQLKTKLIENNETKLANSIKLYIYGKGKQKEELEKLIKENELQEDVFLKGRIPNEKVPEALNDLDICCVTSNNESFGVSIVEAMACEVPVIATKIDGFSEVMEDGVTGILVEKQNVAQIAKAMEDLLRDKEKRIEYGKEGRKRVIEKYNWQDNVKYMASIYKQIYKEHNRSGE